MVDLTQRLTRPLTAPLVVPLEARAVVSRANDPLAALLPPGYAYLTDSDGNYLLGADGAYLYGVA